jgi:hypothetical protein
MSRKIGSQVPECAAAADTEGKVERAAVSKRHPKFGALKGLVHIAPGTDLIDPADPYWGAPAIHDSR